MIQDFSASDFLQELLKKARLVCASDIHIDPAEDQVVCRLRVDGVLREEMTCRREKQDEIITRIKILSGIRIDEHRIAQEGRFRADLGDFDFMDVRVSILPTYYGENAVLRLLWDKATSLTLTDLGMREEDRQKIGKEIRKSFGMIVSAGPTGSGKTTTLYSLLKILHKPTLSLITVEDPIEYALPGVTQIQTNSSAGLTFASGLKSILRQDPDVIMVGEIRDRETAGMAINAALTGHLLMSTLHASNAGKVLVRFLELGIEPYLLNSVLGMVIGQRLVRKICPECIQEQAVDWSELEILREERLKKHLPTRLYKGVGCRSCGFSGYSGRTAIYEVMKINDPLRRALAEKVSAEELYKIAVSFGMTTMLEDGLIKIGKGITSLEEVMRVLYE